MKSSLGLSSLVLSIALLVTACTTPYAPVGATGGYKEQKIDDSTYRVSFNGNGNTSKDMVWNYWIYRCAELTKARGYIHFAITFENPPGAPQPTGFDDSGSPLHTASNEAGEEAGPYLRTKGSGGYYYVPSYGGYSSVTRYNATGVVHMFGETVPLEVTYYLRAQVVLDSLKEYVTSAGKKPSPAREDILKRAGVDASGLAARSPVRSIKYGDDKLEDFKDLLPPKSK